MTSACTPWGGDDRYLKTNLVATPLSRLIMNTKETRRAFQATLQKFYAALPVDRQQTLIAQRLAEYDNAVKPLQGELPIVTDMRARLFSVRPPHPNKSTNN